MAKLVSEQFVELPMTAQLALTQVFGGYGIHPRIRRINTNGQVGSNAISGL